MINSRDRRSNARSRARGFTLIELMVVIAIIGLLAAALLPNIIGAQEAASRAAIEGNLKWHFESLLAYKTKYRKLPPKGGVEFVLAPWVRKTVERTEQNFDRYWIAGIEDPRQQELIAMGYDNAWDDYPEILPMEDTHYAGPDRSKAPTLVSSKVPLMANHHAYFPSLKDGTTICLMGDGAKISVFAEDIGYDPETGGPVPIGDESSHDILSMLTRVPSR